MNTCLQYEWYYMCKIEYALSMYLKYENNVNLFYIRSGFMCTNKSLQNAWSHKGGMLCIQIQLHIVC